LDLHQAIRDFNPEGAFGPRHLHTLPNRVIPPFDATNFDHAKVRDLAKQLFTATGPLMAADQHISNPSHLITSRRRQLRNQLKQLAEFATLEDVASAVLGI